MRVNLPLNWEKLWTEQNKCKKVFLNIRLCVKITEEKTDRDVLFMEWISGVIINLQNYFRLASVKDIADILIVTYLVYKLLGLIRNTTAAQVLKGIALLLILLGLSGLLRLNLLTFLLSNTMQVGLLAIIIIFQPELRKVLETAGGSQFPKLLINREETDKDRIGRVIDQTVGACKTLSFQRIGALIVFERNTFLNDAIKTGTIIDATVSSMLLKNIFFPNAALHDGATIIRDGKIIAAGCMLPLSENINLSKDIGMRHRAGVGATEHSDAIVVIVSEETGSISVAVGGMLKRHLNTETLSMLLTNELIPKEEDTIKKGVFGFFRQLKGNKNDSEN